MPKFLRRRYWWAWIALALLAFAPVYFLLEHPIGTSVVLTMLVAMAVVENRRYRGRLRRLVESRAGESICEFAQSFECHSVDTWVVRAVYEQLQDYLGGSPAVPIRAIDRLKDDLPIDMEDIEMDLAAQIAQRAGRSLTDTTANPYYAKIETVEDLVLFFNAQPKVAV
jgi:hypothetical protein